MNEVERYDTRKNKTGQPAEIEELYESFFGEGTEEERLKIRELAAKLNIRDNDALWIIIYVMNYFGRFYRDLPNKIRESSNACLENIQITAAKICEAEVRKFKNSLPKPWPGVQRRFSHDTRKKRGYTTCSSRCLGHAWGFSACA